MGGNDKAYPRTADLTVDSDQGYAFLWVRPGKEHPDSVRWAARLWNTDVCRISGRS